MGLAVFLFIKLTDFIEVDNSFQMQSFLYLTSFQITVSGNTHNVIDISIFATTHKIPFDASILYFAVQKLLFHTYPNNSLFSIY